MEAKEYLKKIRIEDRVVNREDLSEYWKSISQLMEDYHQSKLHQPTVIDAVCKHTKGSAKNKKDGTHTLKCDDCEEILWQTER